MPATEGLLGRAENWVFGSEDARRLASVRIGLCALLALRLSTTHYRRVATQPAGLFQPTSYMRLFDRMPSPGVASGLQICGVIAALAAAAGVASRSSLSLAVVSSLVLDGMLNSTGRVIVGDAVLTLCLLVILASAPAASEAWAAGPWLRRCRRRARAPAPDTDSKEPSVGPRYGWPIRTAMVTIALSLFFAGFQKLRYSGIAWVTSGNLRWILYASSDSSLHPNALALFIADRPWLAHLCAAGALLLETCFPVVLFVPRLRWYIVAGVVAMHEAIRLAIGLDYRVQGLAMLIVFVDWPAVVEWFGTEFERPHRFVDEMVSGPFASFRHSTSSRRTVQAPS